MSRKSVLLAVGILLLLGLGAAGALLLLLRHEPAFYRDAAPLPGTARKQSSKDFYLQVCALISALNDSQQWTAQFTDEQINSYFAEGFRSSGVEEKMLPDDIIEPRVRLESDRLRLGFRYGSGLRSTVISIDLRVWVAAGEPNVVVLELQGMHAGALPISAQSLLEHVSDAARRQNVDVTWYRHQGNPTALLRFQGKRSRTTVLLQQLQLDDGKLLIQGRSVDPAPVRVSLPGSTSR